MPYFDIIFIYAISFVFQQHLIVIALILYAYYKQSTVAAFHYGAILLLLVQFVCSFYWISNVAYCLHSELIALFTIGTTITLVVGAYVGREMLKHISFAKLVNIFIVMFVCYELFINGIIFSLDYGAIGWLISVSVISLLLFILISLFLFIVHFTHWKTALERAYYLKLLGFIFFFIFFSCCSFTTMWVSSDCGI